MLRSLRVARTAGLVVGLTLAALTARSGAQPCFGNDNLDNGNCCGPAQANLPPFQQVALPGLGVCWDNCKPSMQNLIRVDWPPLVAVKCTEFHVPMTVTDSGTGAVLMVGKAVFNYTRTWTEVDPAGALQQVWRFVVKVDFSPATAAGAAPPCPVPSCLVPVGQHQTAFFYGYCDYSQPCGALAQRQSLVLWHAGDFLIHKFGLSDRPGVFHPARSYGIIAPHTTAQPFVPMNLPAPGGPLLAEAVRRVNTPAGLCAVEEKVVGGAITPFVQGCLCPLSPVAPQNTLSVFSGKAACGSDWASQMIGFPNLPWPHMVQTSIGCWTNPNLFPGNECVWVDEGLFRYTDACAQNAYFEVFYGATTAGGFQVVQPSTVFKTFTDVADNYSAPVGGPHPLPLFGSIRPTDHLIYVNTP